MIFRFLFVCIFCCCYIGLSLADQDYYVYNVANFKEEVSCNQPFSEIGDSKDNYFEKTQIRKKETLEEKTKRIDKICKKLLEYEGLSPIGKGLGNTVGKKVEWCLDNFVRDEGWQLTGWSKMRLDKDFNYSRLKIGVINPEMSESKPDSEERFESDFEEYRKNEKGVYIGFFWTKRF